LKIISLNIYANTIVYLFPRVCLVTKKMSAKMSMKFVIVSVHVIDNALPTGVISLAFTCFMLAMSFLASSVYETIAPIFAILLFVLWASAAYLTTIKGPFNDTPLDLNSEINRFISRRTGFLGMWAGFFLSFSILKSRLAGAEISSMLGCTSCTVNVN